MVNRLVLVVFLLSDSFTLFMNRKEQEHVVVASEQVNKDKYHMIDLFDS